MKYSFTYDYAKKMWIFKELDMNLEIRITKWSDTRKGPLVDIAIFDSKDSDIFYEIELLTKSLDADQMPRYCKNIVNSYKTWGEKFLNLSLMGFFPKCNVNAYCREGQGNDSKLLKYAGKSYNFFGKRKSFFYEADGKIEKTWPKPALEYPGTRLDTICD